MIKNKSLVKHKRTIKKRKHKRTVKQRKYKRTVKQRRYKRYGGDQQYTIAERKVVIDEFTGQQIPLLQNAIKNKSNQLDAIVKFYTFILENANPLLKIEGFRKILNDKMMQIESQENIWFDPIYRDENNGNLNELKPMYFQLKAELQDKAEKYNRLYG